MNDSEVKDCHLNADKIICVVQGAPSNVPAKSDQEELFSNDSDTLLCTDGQRLNRHGKDQEEQKSEQQQCVNSIGITENENSLVSQEGNSQTAGRSFDSETLSLHAWRKARLRGYQVQPTKIQTLAQMNHSVKREEEQLHNLANSWERSLLKQPNLTSRKSQHFREWKDLNRPSLSTLLSNSPKIRPRSNPITEPHENTTGNWEYFGSETGDLNPIEQTHKRNRKPGFMREEPSTPTLSDLFGSEMEESSVARVETPVADNGGDSLFWGDITGIANWAGVKLRPNESFLEENGHSFVPNLLQFSPSESLENPNPRVHNNMSQGRDRQERKKEKRMADLFNTSRLMRETDREASPELSLSTEGLFPSLALNFCEEMTELKRSSSSSKLSDSNQGISVSAAAASALTSATVLASALAEVPLKTVEKSPFNETFCCGNEEEAVKSFPGGLMATSPQVRGKFLASATSLLLEVCRCPLISGPLRKAQLQRSAAKLQRTQVRGLKAEQQTSILHTTKGKKVSFAAEGMREQALRLRSLLQEVNAKYNNYKEHLHPLILAFGTVAGDQEASYPYTSPSLTAISIAFRRLQDAIKGRMKQMAQ